MGHHLVSTFLSFLTNCHARSVSIFSQVNYWKGYQNFKYILSLGISWLIWVRCLLSHVHREKHVGRPWRIQLIIDEEQQKSVYSRSEGYPFQRAIYFNNLMRWIHHEHCINSLCLVCNFAWKAICEIHQTETCDVKLSMVTSTNNREQMKKINLRKSSLTCTPT